MDAGLVLQAKHAILRDNVSKLFVCRNQLVRRLMVVAQTIAGIFAEIMMVIALMGSYAAVLMGVSAPAIAILKPALVLFLQVRRVIIR